MHKLIKFKDEFIELIKQGRKTATIRDKMISGVRDIVNQDGVPQGIRIAFFSNYTSFSLEKIRNFLKSKFKKKTDFYTLLEIVKKEGFSNIKEYLKVIEDIYGKKAFVSVNEFKVIKINLGGLKNVR